MEYIIELTDKEQSEGNATLTPEILEAIKAE